MAEVTVRSLTNLQQQILAPPRSFVGDEPAEWDGDDVGSTPYEFLLGALGSCTNMTLLGYARRKGWPLEGIQTVLRHSRDYGEDCLRCEEEGRYLDVIERQITLYGPLDEKQRAMLAKIARKCPVHKTLSKEISVRDYLESEDLP